MPKPKEHQKLPGVAMFATRALMSRGMRVPQAPGAGVRFLGGRLWYAAVTEDRETGAPRGPRWIVAHEGKPYEVLKADPRAAVQP